MPRHSASQIGDMVGSAVAELIAVALEPWPCSIEDMAELRPGDLRRMSDHNIRRCEALLRKRARQLGAIVHKTRRRRGRHAHTYCVILPAAATVICQPGGYGLSLPRVARILSDEDD